MKPWAWEFHGSAGRWTLVRGTGDHDRSMVNLGGPPDVDPAKHADMALIAAAPDLYEALDQLLDDMGEDGHSVCEAAKQQAIAALKKARGE